MPELRWIGEPRLTAGLDRHERLALAAHRAIHGRPPQLPIGALTALVSSVDLRGRGGAAFPLARKMQSVASAAQRAPGGHAQARLRRGNAVVVVNATEGEPACAKDKLLVTRAPHLVLDGALLAGGALSASEVVIAVTDAQAQQSMTDAIEEAGRSGYARVAVLPHRFITGESSALVRGINGGPAVPPGRKVRTAERGVAGLPTLLANAETYAQLALLARLGPRRYREVGTPAEPGTVLLTVATVDGGQSIVEAPTGVKLREVLKLCGVAIGEGVLTGGYHGRWLSAKAARTVQVSREALHQAGGALGAGAVLAVGQQTCPLGEVARVAAYLALEGADQCGPCRLGLPSVARGLARLHDGAGGAAAVESVRAAATEVRGRGACSHPDGTAGFVLSALEVFAEHVALHLERGSCGRQVQGLLPVPVDPTGFRLHVDWTRCDAHGLCADVAPGLIRLGEDGFPVVPDMAAPPWLAATARRAVEVCPALALRMVPAAAKPSAVRRSGSPGPWPSLLARLTRPPAAAGKRQA